MPDEIQEEYTGSALVALDEDLPGELIIDVIAELESTAKIHGFSDALGDVDKIEVFPELGAAVLPGSPEVLRQFLKDVRWGRVSVGPERYLRVPPEPTQTMSGPESLTAAKHPLTVIGVSNASPAGAVTVAILDSGFTAHPDFAGRDLKSRTFTDIGPDDPTGHGTHSTGIACGPLTPHDGSARYGVAHAARIRAGCVVNSYGRSSDRVLWRGMAWARRKGAVVAYMSAGAPVQFGGKHSVEFERVAARMLRRGLLLVAPAGNAESYGALWPVNHPGNCPSIMAVGALDHNSVPAPFSCVSVNHCQKVDIAAPGLEIISSHNDGKYFTRSGTCQAAAYVAGVAALWAGGRCKPRGWQLWTELVAHAIRLPGYEKAAGAGIVQAPR